MSAAATRPSPYMVRKRRDAAEAVCWRLGLMMELGGLDLPPDEREYLGEAVCKWADLAADTGVMTDDRPAAERKGAPAS